MAALTSAGQTRRAIPSRIDSSREFIQVLMKLQRATNLIASTLDLDALLDRVVNDIADSIGCVKVAVWLRARDTNEMILRGVRGCTMYQKGDRLQIGWQGIVGYVAATGKMRYTRDVHQDPYYIACERDTRPEVGIPLRTAGLVIGIVCIDHHQIDAVSDDQLKVLQALAGHIDIAIENARLFPLERFECERMLQESVEARAIQQALFLKPVPLIPGFAFETAWHPAGGVAGDWFDFIDLGHERFGIALADVSGKGMSAVLLMSATRALHPGQRRTPAFPAHQSSLFVSRTRYRPAASPRRVLIPGVHDHARPSAQLLLYTDGITEAMSSAEEEYGSVRLIEHFLRPGACVDGLIADVQRFGAGSDRTDDATAVLVRSR